MVDKQFKIGEVSQIFDISVRALRLYDKIGLLKPDYIDSETKYRYYTNQQLTKLKAIIGLRKVGLSLDLIRQLLDPSLSCNQVMRILQEQKMENTKQIDILAYNNEIIDEMIETARITNKVESMDTLSQEEHDLILSKIASLQNPKMENELIDILWL
jgi:DNA-binding transcriptional MerR regulator